MKTPLPPPLWASPKGPSPAPAGWGRVWLASPTAPRPLVSRALLMDEVATAGLGSRGHTGQPACAHIDSPSPPFSYLLAPTSKPGGDSRFGGP